MDVEAVDEGENSDRPVSENVETGKGQEQNMTVNLAEREVNNQNGDAYRKPQVGMLFESEDAAKSFYNAYARHVGFSTHVGQFNRAKPDGPIITWDFACSREVVLTCFKSMTWIISNKNSSSSSKIAVINMKLQDYGKGPLGETEVQFRVTRVTLEPMLRSMTYISQQLNAPVNRVAIINLRLQDTKTTTGQTELKFQVSRDTLGSMLRSVTYIQEQL
ncbi:Protein FAR1-RELATED SEQUENCE 3 [Glycine soja]|nr:Protein FAR1-RELATED SEQUENCE 3 [Glycine soja]